MFLRQAVSIGIFAAVLSLAMGCARSQRFAEAWQASSRPMAAELARKGCDLHEDAAGIFHARGTDELAAFACFGYLHGRERGFQADYLRRVAQGRSAEVLGWSQLKSDFFLRVLGLAERAEKLTGELAPDERQRLDAYAEGMNRGLSEALKRGHYAFRRLGYEPEPWRAQDTVAILLLESFFETQTSLWQRLKEEKWRESWGAQAAALFRTDGLPWDTSILKDAESPRATAAERSPGWDTREGAAPFPAPPVETPEGAGSNSWVLRPARSRTGHAWFANDPHVELHHPPFWFWTHVEGGDLDVTGATVPGVPIVASGFNRHAAWGLTDSYIDAGEVLSVPEDETRSLPSVRPTIRIRFGPLLVPFVFKTFQRTEAGLPVLPIDGPRGRKLVLRWSGFWVSARGLSEMSRLMKVRSAKEADEVFGRFELPTWNYVFADTAGNIGYRAQGLVLRQAATAQIGVRDGSAADTSAPEFLSPEEAPHVYNPERGFIVTANNRQWPPGAPYSLGRSHRQGFRGFRIEELMASTERHDLETQRSIQCDTQAVDGRFLAPKLVELGRRIDPVAVGWGAREKAAVELLSKWDFRAGIDCRACGVYYRWFERIAESQNVTEPALYRLLDGAAEREHFTRAVAKALSNALDDLSVVDGREPPPWGNVHRIYFAHLSKSPLFASQDSLPTPGTSASVSPANGSWVQREFRQTGGASQRILVELSSPPRAWFRLAGPNRDVEQKQLSAAGSAWQQWMDCRLEQVAYPLDWGGVQVERVGL